jgi:hypothetical protein
MAVQDEDLLTEQEQLERFVIGRQTTVAQTVAHSSDSKINKRPDHTDISRFNRVARMHSAVSDPGLDFWEWQDERVW